MPSSEKKLTIAQVKAIATRIAGARAIISMLDEPEEIEVIPTGSVLIDYVTGIGGFPLGRIVELFGTFTSGKTSLALHIAANATKQGRVLWLDFEHAFGKEYATILGVPMDTKDLFLLSQPDTLEQGMRIAEMFIENELARLIVVDSLPAMITKVELEGKLDKIHIAPQARAMAKVLKRLVGITHASNTCLVFINHVRDRIETGWAASMGLRRKTTPGGVTLKFYSHLRIELRKAGAIRKKVMDPATGERADEVVANKIKVSVVKNKLAPPFKSCVVYLTNDQGFSEEMSLLDVGVARGVIAKKGASLIFGEEITGGEPIKVTSSAKAMEKLGEEEGLREALSREVHRLLWEKKGEESQD